MGEQPCVATLELLGVRDSLSWSLAVASLGQVTHGEGDRNPVSFASLKKGCGESAASFISNNLNHFVWKSRRMNFPPCFVSFKTKTSAVHLAATFFLPCVYKDDPNSSEVRLPVQVTFLVIQTSISMDWIGFSLLPAKICIDEMLAFGNAGTAWEKSWEMPDYLRKNVFAKLLKTSLKTCCICKISVLMIIITVIMLSGSKMRWFPHVMNWPRQDKPATIENITTICLYYHMCQCELLLG